MMQISEHLFRCEDTCNVYAVLSGDEAVLIDFGDGSILRELPAIGVNRVTAVLMTHHHRDQGQGLPLAIAAGACVWVPHAEQDLFCNVEAHWQAREIFNNYNVRQDLFSLLDPVPVTGTLHDYGKYRFGSHEFTIVPTPGHTPGAISLLTEIDGRWIAFSGDLIAAPGKVWSISATQWTYNGAEGVAASIPSLIDLKERRPDLLLPSHGDPIILPGPAIDTLVERFWQLLQRRQENPRLFLFLEKPYISVTPHLLHNRTSLSNSYVLLSKSGKALLIDYGYDFMTGAAAGADRASRRPWLYTLGALKRDFGVQKLDVVLPTHYHDDHVAGLNLLREVEGTQVWAAENFADVLERPSRYDLPCLWYDPIAVDRCLPLDRSIGWEEYELSLHALPGHTRYAVAIAFQVDGRRVLAVGDQYQGSDGLAWNYVYRNHFQPSDYRASAAYYRQTLPELILPGHWDPFWVAPGYLEALEERGEALEQLHRQLLGTETTGGSSGNAGLWIRPYQAEARGGEALEFEVEVQNPFPQAEMAHMKIVLPPLWECGEEQILIMLEAGETRMVKFVVKPPEGSPVRRARIAVDLTLGNRRFGQQAEALVTVV
jgi:glyoxylase-like metal-dependent hydrolase (beta-lactamase superfamily II)